MYYLSSCLWLAQLIVAAIFISYATENGNGGRAFYAVRNTKNDFTSKRLSEFFYLDIHPPATATYARVSIKIRLWNSINLLFSAEKCC